ncbi:MAG: DUF4168 domain-containing protein [Chitinivibrionales bacterium]
MLSISKMGIGLRTFLYLTVLVSFAYSQMGEGEGGGVEEPAMDPPQAEAEEETEEVADEELKKFAEVNQLMQGSSEKNIEDVLEDKELSVDKYQQIGEQLQKDKDLQERYIGIIKEDQEDQGESNAPADEPATEEY